MKKRISVALVFCWFSFSAVAQRVPVELVAGTNNHRYQHTFTQQADSSSFGFFNTSSLQIYPGKNRADEVMSQSYLTYKVAEGVKIAVGAFYASGPGFRPAVSLQFHKKWPSLLWVAVPRVDVWRNPSAEVMTMIEYRPRLSKQVKLYSRLQLMENFTGTVHNRSYQHVRLGIDISNVQFGVATNLEVYGREMNYQPNYGLFFRKELF